MVFLKALLAKFKSIFQNTNLDTPQPYPQIVDKEEIARFLTSNKDCNKSFVKHGAFVPRPKGEGVSVIRIDGINDNQIKGIDKKLSHKRQSKLLGIAIFTAMQVNEVEQLSLEIDIKDDPRHANILGFSLDDSFELMQRTELAKRSILRRY